VSDEDNSTDRVSEARVPNLRAECTSAGRGCVKTALEQERKEINDKS
jgi:hypothetical protein